MFVIELGVKLIVAPYNEGQVQVICQVIRLLLISFHGDRIPISQATQHMYNAAYLKIMYSQNDSKCLIHVLGAWEKILNECISQNCESQPIICNYFSILYDQI